MQRNEAGNPQLSGIRKKTRAVDDVFIAAHKRLKRRGSLAPGASGEGNALQARGHLLALINFILFYIY